MTQIKPFPVLLVQAQFGVFRAEQSSRDEWQEIFEKRAESQEIEKERSTKDTTESEAEGLSAGSENDQKDTSFSEDTKEYLALKKSFDKTLIILEIMSTYEQPSDDVDTISRALLATLELLVFEDTQVFEYDYMKQLILTIMCNIVEKVA